MKESEKIKITPQQQQGMTEYLDWFHDSRRAGIPQKALLRYYKDDFDENGYQIEVSGQKYNYPVFTRSEWVKLRGQLGSYIGSRSSAKRQEHKPDKIRRVAREMYMRHHKPEEKTVEFPISKVLWNGKSVCVAGWDHGKSPVSFRVEKTDFFSYVSTGESMLRELFDELWDEKVTDINDDEGISTAINNLDYRDRKAGRFEEFTQWSKHFHKAGAVCLLVLEREDGNHDIIFSKRSPYVLQEPGLHSVTPGGELQAENIHESSLDDLIIKELTEEVLAAPDEVSGSIIPTNDGVTADEMRGTLKQAVDNNQIKIRRTGFAFDMMAVKPILAGLVYVQDPQISQTLKKCVTTNWESDTFKRIQIPHSGVPKEMHPNFSSTSGAFAFFEGLRTLQRAYNVDIGMDIDWKI